MDARLSRASARESRPRAHLPADAVETGYRQGETQLWMTPGEDFVYLVTGSTTERWPRQPPNEVCA